MKKAALFLILTASLLFGAEVFEEGGSPEGKNRMRMNPERMQERVLDKISSEDPERAKELRRLREENPEAFHREMKEILKNNMPEHDLRGHNPRHRDDYKPGPGERFRAKFKQRFDQRNEEFIQWLEENFPDEAEKMKKAFEADPDSAFKNTAYIRNRYRKIFEIEKRYPEMAELMKHDLELKQRREEIIEQLRSCENKQEKKELQDELRDIVSMRFNVILEKRRLKLEDLNEKLKQIQQEINKQQKDLETLDQQRESLIETRIKELFEESNKRRVDWE